MEPLFGPTQQFVATHRGGYGANALWFHGFDPAAFEVLRHDIAAASSSKPSGQISLTAGLILWASMAGPSVRQSSGRPPFPAGLPGRA